MGGSAGKTILVLSPSPKCGRFFKLWALKSVSPSDKWGYVEIGLGPFWIFFDAPSTLFDEAIGAAFSTEAGTLLGLPSGSAHRQSSRKRSVAPKVVCLVGVEWPFAQDHHFLILFRTTKEFEMLARLNGDAECASS